MVRQMNGKDNWINEDWNAIRKDEARTKDAMRRLLQFIEREDLKELRPQLIDALRGRARTLRYLEKKYGIEYEKFMEEEVKPVLRKVEKQ